MVVLTREACDGVTGTVQGEYAASAGVRGSRSVVTGHQCLGLCVDTWSLLVCSLVSG